ncbi:MAG: TrkH family potassium uptake protein [Candidatus Methanomethylophilaceae archaeon]|nr:TrkH family potassium uptake protein [Candidatus Methanomethylophilaceae archaeon]
MNVEQLVRPRWESSTIKLIGTIELILALVLLIPSVIALVLNEDVLQFLIPVPVLLAFGVFQTVFFDNSHNDRAANILLLVGLTWLLMFAVGTVPYLYNGYSPVDAVFESVAGFTTTGASIMADLSDCATSLLIWRSLTQWIGGIAVIMIFMYILPMLGAGRSFFMNELAGSGSSSFSVKMRTAAKSFILVYVALSAVNLVLLLALQVEWDEALCLAFTTISTGGSIPTENSMAGYGYPVQIVTLVFMFLGGTNFYLHYSALVLHQRKVYRRNSEFKTYLVWFVAISIIVYLMVVLRMADVASLTLEDHARYYFDSLFTTVALGTSAAFTTVDYTLFPQQCIVLLMIVALLGASSGSTGGGIKIARLHVVYQSVRNSMFRTLHPNSVVSVKVDKQPLDDSAVLSAFSVMMMFFVTLAVGVVIFLMLGHEFTESVGMGIASISNLGLGLGEYGPQSTFAGLDSMSKVLMVILMWVGRLEVFTALVFFTPGFWREIWMSHRARVKSKKASRSK